MHRNREDQAVADSYELLIAIWKQFSGDFEGSHIEDKKFLTVSWADTPFPFWNVIFLSKAVHSTEQLRAAADEAAAIAATKKQSGLICVCSNLLDKKTYERADSILSNAGYPDSTPITGMTAEPFPIALACPTTLRIERLKDFQIPTELNCGAYGVPLAAAQPSTLSEQFAQEAFIYVGYETDRPVCTAVVLVQEDVLYLALVATDENARNRGYGEAIVRHALQKAHERTDLTKAALHASMLGEPIYTRIGFRSVADFRWYLRRHD